MEMDCPFCARKIAADAKTCPLCGMDLVGAEASSQELELQSNYSPPPVTTYHEKKSRNPVQPSRPCIGLGTIMGWLIVFAGLGYGGWLLYHKYFVEQPVAEVLPKGIEPPRPPPEVLEKPAVSPPEEFKPAPKENVVVETSPLDIEIQKKNAEMGELRTRLAEQQALLPRLDSECAFFDSPHRHPNIPALVYAVNACSSRVDAAYCSWIHDCQPRSRLRMEQAQAALKAAKKDLAELQGQKGKAKDKCKSCEYAIKQIEIKIKYKQKAIDKLKGMAEE